MADTRARVPLYYNLFSNLYTETAWTTDTSFLNGVSDNEK